MKVFELIEQLFRMPPLADVYRRDPTGHEGMNEIKEVAQLTPEAEERNADSEG